MTPSTFADTSLCPSAVNNVTSYALGYRFMTFFVHVTTTWCNTPLFKVTYTKLGPWQYLPSLQQLRRLGQVYEKVHCSILLRFPVIEHLIIILYYKNYEFKY